MRNSMIYPIRFWALLLTGLLLYQFSTEVFGDYCKYEKQIDMTLDLSSSDSLSIIAVAGDLDVVGVAGASGAVIHGRVCASREDWLETSSVVTQAGSQAQISVDLPDINGGWSLTGNRYVSMDLRVEVPQDLLLEVKDSSGDIFLKDVSVAAVSDSSGDLEIDSGRHAVSIRDSSGDIDIDRSNADVTIESDSSGDIYVNEISGSLLVVRDSSGDIEARGVGGDVIVERDSSGDISVRDVSGNFSVLKDGSGGITSNNVQGEISIPNKG